MDTLSELLGCKYEVLSNVHSYLFDIVVGYGIGTSGAGAWQYSTYINTLLGGGYEDEGDGSGVN